MMTANRPHRTPASPALPDAAEAHAAIVAPMSRREVLLQFGGTGLAIACTGWPLAAAAQSLSAADWNKAGFEAKTVAEAVRGLGATQTTPSKDIVIDVQDVIENGARARIEVTSRIPGTQSLSIITDNNPYPLAATFNFANGADAYVSTLLKIAESGTIRVIVNAGGKLFATTRDVKVTLGGCG
jgi:sulfur-oxidizing protein SoxY